MNNRRKLVIALGAGALAAPLGAFPQQPAAGMHRIGFLGTTSAEVIKPRLEALRGGLRDLGYVEGKNLVIEWRFADNTLNRLSELAAELARIKVDIIVTSGLQAVGAAQKATTTIPIVMTNSPDPVGSGFVKTLARPGGNITGLSSVSVDIGPKHLEMLLSMVPKLSRVVVLTNPNNSANASSLKNIQAAARKTGVTILPLEARAPQEIENAFSMTAQKKAGAVIVVTDSFFTQQGRQIAELAAKHRLPSISASREYADAGGLMSYGPNVADGFRRAATYVDKIFKGAKPADLPVEQPMKFELFINGKTAKALGLKIPQSLLISADKVIE